LTRGMIQAPPRDENLRRRLKERVRRSGVERCHRLLSRLDPDYAASIRNNDERRIVRALEVRIACGKPLGLLIQDDPFGSRPLEPHMGIGLTAPRELLYHRIESRVEAMLASGWIEEVQVLLEEDKLRGCVSKAIGYEEIAEHLAGRMPLEEAAEKIKQRSRNYAKRQLTWFRKEPGITWYTVTEGRWEENAIRSIEHWLEEIVRHT